MRISLFATLSSIFIHRTRSLSPEACSIMFRKIPESKLGVSEPNPAWFGNAANPRNDPKWTNSNWLKSRFHFSFAEYSNPRNMGFGVLRVLNDDLVQPSRGFGEHPHRDAEICTYIIDGQLTHKDSMKTQETIGRGAIQFMTAGSGVTHSEHNLDPNNPLRFIQIWINPRKRGLPPNYGSAPCPPETRLNKFAHLVSDVLSDKATNIKINQDLNIHVAEVMPGNKVTFDLGDKRQAYMLCMEGTADVVTASPEGTATEFLKRHDAAEVFGESTISVTPQGQEPVHVMILEMAFTGVGRTDL